jgi:hypothetical protein
LNFSNPPSEHHQKWLKSRLCVIAGSGRVELVGTVVGSSDGLAEGDGIKDGSDDGASLGFDDGLEEGFEDGLEEASEEGLEEASEDGLEDGIKDGYDGGLLLGIALEALQRVSQKQ